MRLAPFLKFLQNRILPQILFWFASIAIFGYIFKISDTMGSLDVIYSLLFHISILSEVYTNIFVLVPLVLHQKKYIRYGIFFLIITLIASILNHLTFTYFSDILLPDYYFVVQFNFFETYILAAIFLVGSTFFKLSQSWFKLQEANRQIIKIEKENINNQLEALKAQINPHFLFNSLNVLYSLALKSAKETPETIIKLSDILRYVIYGANQEKVSIAFEVELINNYLSLQKHRVDKTSNIHFETDIQMDIHIAPMLFLPLVENSFKHGVKGDVSNTFVHIKMETTHKAVNFEIENNKGTSDNPGRNNALGIGLLNIKKRLHLLYPDKHSLTIKDKEHTFKVTLKIKL